MRWFLRHSNNFVEVVIMLVFRGIGYLVRKVAFNAAAIVPGAHRALCGGRAVAPAHVCMERRLRDGGWANH